jgi:hypothetical protein
MRKGALLSFLLLTLTPGGAASAAPAERILTFHSDIDVGADGGVTVRETIRVSAAGQKIRRGIYREFPTRYRDRFNNRVTVGFTVLEVLRDGKPEPYHRKPAGNGTRVYIGRSDVFIDPGEYTYTLVYRTDRQIGFFEDFDEIYWNVTGNGWEFAIDEASAVVRLPPGATVSALKKSLRTDFAKLYFRNNAVWLLPGAVLSILTVAAVVMMSGGGDDLGGRRRVRRSSRSISPMPSPLKWRTPGPNSSPESWPLRNRAAKAAIALPGTPVRGMDTPSGRDPSPRASAPPFPRRYRPRRPLRDPAPAAAAADPPAAVEAAVEGEGGNVAGMNRDKPGTVAGPFTISW